MIIDPELEHYAAVHTRAEPELLQRLAAETYRMMDSPQMLTGRVEGRLLKLLVGLSGARRVLEIGTFTGYSALSMAEALPDDGRLITCEIDPEAERFARGFFAQSPHGGKIDIRLGPALETLAGLDGPFDLVFVDADKENYPAYFEAVIDKVRPGGLLLFDNALWGGRVLKPASEADRAIHRLNGILARDSRVENALLTVRDGVQLVRKRA